MEKEHFNYDNKIVRNFAVATIVWGIVGMTVGLLIAMQMYLPKTLNIGEYLSFGRTRPLHTNAVIFAFVGNAIYMGVYYSLQRLLKTRMFSDTLSKIHFWGWQLIIVAAALTLPLGITTSHEYAELEWPIDIAIAVIWVVFGWNMFGTILRRREKHLYVAIWFYIATFVTVAMLHIVNSIQLPIGLFKSYYWFAGVQDALVQWWYGHNAVAFFLTTPFLGLMYYYMPKMANRPVYSYRLSILHFWSLIFLYIWAGPHHLLYTSLPGWAQSLGVIFSVMLIAPSWGGMLNGLLTLRGAWDKVRDSALLKFMVVGITCYGMSTFEGPMLSIKSVNKIGHYTDWIVAHVHVGALGWNGFLTFAMLYWLIPKIYNTKLHSKKMASSHFWLGTLGIIFYAIPMYFAGFTQGSMWSEFNPDGTLMYQFLQTVTQIKTMYILRSIGGALYLGGVILMAVNLVKTMVAGKLLSDEAAEAYPLAKDFKPKEGEHWHRWIERKPVQMLVLSLVIVGIGGLVEIIPTFLVESNVKTIATVKPYTPLELEGRDVYIKEGCVSCHSQMVRPFRDETQRYGDYHKAGEFVYDHPFLWGSKRTGPDLGRAGDKSGEAKMYKTAKWHYQHFMNPPEFQPGSIMPKYDWLAEKEVDLDKLTDKISAMRTLGVPYAEGYERQAKADYIKQSQGIEKELKENGIKILPNSEMVALIAYLQRLGGDLNKDLVKGN